MRFTPKTEEELQLMTLLEPGIYQFQVSTATNEMSKSGNEMIKLTLNIWDKDGRLHFIYDYLLEAMGYKLRHFCETTGLIDKYDHGEINVTDCINRQGYVELAIQEGKLKDNGERYPSRNSVKDYIKKSKVESANDLNDDIPF
ncbi:DUF669 domain-containing protein [Legionella micdadei]|uniref:DUF669 domain-containing protein n=1 Tax=Legionella micdadei TaxID=451 RepID=A0A098GET6_LEGMI|nr:DUF669 domain-containing protein [Legionella micdadei]KTD27510.1 hypothetical protein Lmic_2139 [Legionella micdadei]CEG60979.1 protein of unknown function [Legionella micdadei]SCY69916.1 Protein of unknown function [Legionella micdadei]